MSEKPRPITITDPVTVTVNGKEIEAQKGELLIDACERNGAYIPRFCYHPRMTPVGMCRMCLVEVDTGRGPALQPSCMLECGGTMTVDTESPAVRKAQDGVLEFLLANHPLDCPVCDKGGECPLQDQTVAYGPGESRWVEEKRHYEKPIAISETVMLDRERCILCDRCTRFADEVAGDALIHFMGRGSNTEVNTFPGEPFSSYFSGNTVQICPVGALTAKPYRFKARPWDLEQVESTCTTCSVGCRVTVQSSADRVLRNMGVDSDPVNWSWLCDKGRFGFESIHHADRLVEPLVRSGDELVPARWNDALDRAAALLREGLDRSGPGGIAVLGGARLTNEAAYAWVKLAKGVIGTDHVDAQLGDGLRADAVLGLPKATIDDACRKGGTVLYLGPDPKEQLPILFIRLRHAVIHDGVTLIEIAPQATGLSSLAAESLRCRPGDAASLVEALLAGTTSSAGGVDGQRVAAASALLKAADGPVTVVLGRTSLAESDVSVVDAAALLLDGLEGVRFLSALRRANVHGALDMGMSPGLLPGRVRRAEAHDWFAQAWPTVPDADGHDARGILQAAAEGRIDTLILLGSDPLRDFPDHALAERALRAARNVIVVDTFLNSSADRADVVLAAAGFGEVSGTTTNLEGRVTILNQKVTAPGTARPDWLIAGELARRLDADLGFAGVDDIWAEVEELSIVHAGMTADVLAATGHADGIVAPMAVVVPEPAPDDSETDETSEVDDDQPGDAASEDWAPPVVVEAPELLRFEAPPRTSAVPVDSYSLRLFVTRELYDDGTLLQHCESSAGLSKPSLVRIHPHDLATIGVETGGRVRLTGAERSLVVEVVATPSLPTGLASVVFGQPGVEIGRLIDSAALVTEVRMEAAP